MIIIFLFNYNNSKTILKNITIQRGVVNTVLLTLFDFVPCGSREKYPKYMRKVCGLAMGRSQNGTT